MVGGMNRSVLIALCILLGLTVYMLTGLVGCGGPAEAEPAPEMEKAMPLMSVQVREMAAEEISREVMLNGKTAPNRAVDIKAETSGKVIEVGHRRGFPVKEGDLIARIEMRDREQRLEQARASLEQAKFLYDASLRLQKQELNSPSQVAESLSRLRGAEQVVEALELDIDKTSLVVPFDGILQERMVEVGDYLGIGDPVARVIDLDPVIVSGISVGTGKVLADRISPARISIADDGRFGIKIVDEDNTVRFVEADIVRSEPEALWLAGLPPEIRLITIGQGFTQPGDEVVVEMEKEAWQ